MLIKMVAIIALTVALAALSGCRNEAGKSAGDDVAARVGDAVIRLSEVDRLIEQQLLSRAQQGQPTPPTAAELAAARLQILENLVTQEALHQKASRADLIPTNDEVSQEIQKFKSAQQLSEEGFQRTLRDEGQTEQRFREAMRRRVAIQKLFDKEVAPRVTVTDREIEDFYHANRAKFVERKGLSLSQIKIDPEKNDVSDDAVGADAAARKAAEVYEQLRKGADFATVAVARSEDTLTAARGGSLGFIGANAPGVPSATQQRLSALSEGAVMEPIKSGDSWYIFKLDRRFERDREVRLDEVRADIDMKLRADREQILQTALSRIALSEIRVENLLARRMLASPANFGSLRGVTVPAAPAQPGQK